MANTDPTKNTTQQTKKMTNTDPTKNRGWTHLLDEGNESCDIIYNLNPNTSSCPSKAMTRIFNVICCSIFEFNHLR
jgi:hypothetical protein